MELPPYFRHAIRIAHEEKVGIKKILYTTNEGYHEEKLWKDY